MASPNTKVRPAMLGFFGKNRSNKKSNKAKAVSSSPQDKEVMKESEPQILKLKNQVDNLTVTSDVASLSESKETSDDRSTKLSKRSQKASEMSTLPSGDTTITMASDDNTAAADNEDGTVKVSTASASTPLRTNGSPHFPSPVSVVVDFASSSFSETEIVLTESNDAENKALPTKENVLKEEETGDSAEHNVISETKVAAKIEYDTNAVDTGNLNPDMYEREEACVNVEKSDSMDIEVNNHEEKPKICYYDINPTVLYKLIERMEWDDVLDRCVATPHEVSTWVVRHEGDVSIERIHDKITNPVRWSMIPLHAAVIFHAPLEVIASLVRIFPDGLTCEDDRKMLPLHLACRMISGRDVVAFLVESSLTSLKMKDYKGRTPFKILLEYHEKTSKKPELADKNETKKRDDLIKLLRSYNDHDLIRKNDGDSFFHDSEHSVVASTSSTVVHSVRGDDETQTVSNTERSQGLQKYCNKYPREVDYDSNPTILVKLIEKKMWNEAIERCYDHPHEAATWMCRLQEIYDNERKKKEVRWRILPIHSAIVLHAPVNVVEALIDAYPEGVREGDDRLMLPLHMAFRLGADLDTAAALVDAYPEALDQKDSKGHTPLHILKAYRKKYEKDRSRGKRGWSLMDKNRKALIKFYVSRHTYHRNGENGDVEYMMERYDSVSESDSESSDDYDSDDSTDTESDSDDENIEGDEEYDNLFYKDMFTDFGRLTFQGLSNLPEIVQDYFGVSVNCRAPKNQTAS